MRSWQQSGDAPVPSSCDHIIPVGGEVLNDGGSYGNTVPRQSSRTVRLPGYDTMNRKELRVQQMGSL